LLEIVAGRLLQDRRRERSERLTVFDPGVQNIFHFGAARIDQDAAIPEGARTPFLASLKPAHDLAVSNVRGRGPEQLVLGKPLDLAITIGRVARRNRL